MNATLAASRPANPWLSDAARIHAITPEIEGVLTYHLAHVDPKVQTAYECRPGQFNMLYLPGVGEVAISISGRSPIAGAWAHTVRAMGNVTQTLARYQPGDTLGLRGPYGSCWPLDECRGQDVVIVAGGIGLAPLRPAIVHVLEHRADYGHVSIVYGARTPAGLLYTREFVDWTGRGAALHTTVDRPFVGWKGKVGVVPLLIDRLRPFEPSRTVLLTCGPEVMMRYAARSALQRGLSPERIWVSLERNMQCAVRLCGHCQLGPSFVCQDGPVFRYDRVAPWLAVENL